MTRTLNTHVPSIDTSDRRISPEELEAMEIVALPEREALSVAFPLAGPLSLGGVAKGADAVTEAIDDGPPDLVV